MKNTSHTRIPPKWVVRAVASIMLVIGFVLMYLAVANFTVLGTWFAIGVFAAGLGASVAASMSLYTGDPEWILLNLIISG